MGAIVACLFAVGVLCALYAFTIEPNWLKLEVTEIGINDLPEEFDGYRIAVISDFHYPRSTTALLIRKAISIANGFRPDLIALPGDICDKNRDDPYIVPSLAGLFDHAQAPDGIVGVLGNHDHWLSEDGVRRELEQNTPVRLIENKAIYIERAGKVLAVGGVGDLWEGIVAPEQAFANVPDAIPRILLSHNPDTAEEMDGQVRIDLQISGHTHGGQVRIPFGPALKVPSSYGQKFRAGLVQGKVCRVYITRGLCSVRHVRFWCRPEITGIILRKRQ